MAKLPGWSNKLKALYDNLREDAPEAAVGLAAATLAILFITAAEAAEYSSEKGQDVLLGLGVLFGVVGASGFVAAIIRLYRRK